MGYNITDGFIDHTFRELSDPALRVWLTLRRFADRTTGECYPSQRRLCRITGLSRTSLWRGLIELQSRGAVTITHVPNPNGPGYHNRYTLHYNGL